MKNILLTIATTVFIAGQVSAHSKNQQEKDGRGYCSLEQRGQFQSVFIKNNDGEIKRSLLAAGNYNQAYDVLVKAVSSGQCISNAEHCELEVHTSKAQIGMDENGQPSSRLSWGANEGYSVKLNGILVGYETTKYILYDENKKRFDLGINNPEEFISKKLQRLFDLGICK